MKKRKIILFLSVIMSGVIITGQFAISANGTGVTEEQTESITSIEQESSENQTTETTTADVTGNAEDGVEEKNLELTGDEETDGEGAAENSTGGEMTESVTEPNVDADDDGEDSTEEEIAEPDEEEDEMLSESLYYQGLKYYLNRYQYECEIVYLQSYLEYVKLEVMAGEEMYSVGEFMEADVKSCQVQQASIEAQLQVAKNQSSYNNLFLEQNNLDYSDYIIKENKDVESIDYYIEQYPAKNYMTMAGYVTSYKDAWAYIEAKKVEIGALTMKLDSAKLLYEAGELSKLELMQQETSLAKAQYELEQYYVEMNLAYLNLVVYCR